MDSSYSLTSSKEESLPLSDLANKAVDAAGEIVMRHYLARGNVFKFSNANVPSWTNIAAEAEEAMISLILKDLPCHAVCEKQSGWNNCSGTTIPKFVWVLDPINGAEERLIASCSSQWVKTTRNGDRVKTRASELEQAYVDIKDSDYNKDAKYAYNRLAYKVGETFFSSNCIANSELAVGMLQLVVDCAVEPYGLLGQVPTVEGAGGIITDWQGNQPSPASSIPRNSFKVVASADLTNSPTDHF
ncbi:bifunctional phosphatase IMPL2, chloroplastic-like [Solanum dulcamara]|uniref:bifunctional phosphatase IMPL2, chloroplastic-like n=1 Tax=Solanum dulcamara TaxID=45834 RepID=UPI002486682B|nr:bifunctional phosphatase IMPL2, chloroplastic-like [Solanum dulcamara]